MDLDGGGLDGGGLLIDCDECVMRATDACSDCIVTFLCAEDGAGDASGGHVGAVVIDAAEVRALRLLRDAGMAPELRHTTRDVRCAAR